MQSAAENNTNYMNDDHDHQGIGDHFMQILLPTRSVAGGNHPTGQGCRGYQQHEYHHRPSAYGVMPDIVAWNSLPYAFQISKYCTRATQRTLQIAGFSLALAASVAWVLAATGRLSASAIIGWWIGWSVYEVLIRLSGRRYVKEGPWWETNYRYANLMDMLSYVGFKNLLTGAALFILLKTMGLLQV